MTFQNQQQRSHSLHQSQPPQSQMLCQSLLQQQLDPSVSSTSSLQSSTPQDVLAEARKNLQVLIDSGISKDLLHQWVDGNLSLQISANSPSLASTLVPQSLVNLASHSLDPAASTSSPLLSHPSPHSHSHHLQAQSQLHQHQLQPHHEPHSQAASLPPPLQPPPPPPPQCPPPPIPTPDAHAPSPTVSVTETIATSAATPPTPVSSVSASVPASAAAGQMSTHSTPAINIIKSEPTFAEDVSRAWAVALAQDQSPAVQGSGPGPVSAHDPTLAAVSDADSAIFVPPSIPFYQHRPRISVSSTSSGSSGRASIWSTSSAQSSLSWQSASTCRTQAPLPMPPPMTSPTNTPHVGNPQSAAAVAAAAAAANKQNIYWCTSCETSFKRKYDWKRHEDEFHERWRKYPCPEPGCNRSFWGSNSFNQHHKQCHGCKTCPHAEKVVKFLRKRKYWACGFCSALHPARERHVEHVARHFESGLTKSDWMHSRVVYGLLHQPLIHGAWDALVSSKQQSEHSGRRPQFSWHPTKTGRAQGFLEKENPGQLQDLLEFFSGDEGEAQWIVTVAYDLADIVFTPSAVQSPQFSQGAMGPPPSYQQQPQEVRMSFASMPAQTQQSPMLQSPSSGAHSPYGTSPFRNQIMVPSQAFPTSQQRPSPDSSSHSPMTASHSPLAPSHSPLDKRDLPLPPPPQGQMNDGMMDFEYSPAPVVFEDWESLAAGSSMMDPTSTQQQQQHQQQQATPTDWGMSAYFGDPRISS